MRAGVDVCVSLHLVQVSGSCSTNNDAVLPPCAVSSVNHTLYPLLSRNVTFYTGSQSKEFQKGGRFYCKDPDCLKGAQQADKALVSGGATRWCRTIALHHVLDQSVSAECSLGSDGGEEGWGVR